jgi:hypothetical protein
MIVGTILNSLTFIILCRRSFKNTKKQPIIHYMRTIAIFDILMLYGWNLEHYLSSAYGFTFEGYSIPSCKIYLFFGYFTAQSAAWLRVFVCLDRYLSLSCLHKTWFSYSKNVITIIICTISLFALFNLHIIIFGCYYTSSGVIDINSELYAIFPVWDYIHLGVYNCIPFIFMVILNSGAVYHLIRLRQTSTVQNSRIQHRSISIALLTTTFLFLIMTAPSGIVFGFFQAIASPSILQLSDASLFTYHVTSFPIYMITFNEFRRECIAMITCAKNTVRVQPITTVPPQLLRGPGMIKLKATAHFMKHANIRQNF